MSDTRRQAPLSLRELLAGERDLYLARRRGRRTARRHRRSTVSPQDGVTGLREWLGAEIAFRRARRAGRRTPARGAGPARGGDGTRHEPR